MVFSLCVVVQILLVLRVWYVVGNVVTFDGGGVCCCRFFASIKVLRRHGVGTVMLLSRREADRYGWMLSRGSERNVRVQSRFVPAPPPSKRGR